MDTNMTIKFSLSDSDRKTIKNSGDKQVKLSAEGLADARTESFVPWNCPFDECGNTASSAKDGR